MVPYRHRHLHRRLRHAFCQQQPTSPRTPNSQINYPPKTLLRRKFLRSYQTTAKMQFKLSIAFSALMALSSAMILEPKGKCLLPRARERLLGTVAHLSIAGLGEVRSLEQRPVFSDLRSSSWTKSACDKEDESDCTAFCKANDQTATCTAAGNKITCSCKGGKSESNCEERCLLCES